MLPFLGWLALYSVALWYFVPRLGKVAQAQADARSLMTGRVTDAYTNIATVKLFSHSQREARSRAARWKSSCRRPTARCGLVTGFEIVNQCLSVLLVGGTAGMTLWLWTAGAVGVGAVAAATAMALRLNGISHWVMWELASLFEHVGTVQDGMATLSKARSVVDAPGAKALQVPRGEVCFEHVDFGYGGTQEGHRRPDLVIRPGEKIGLVGRSGRRQEHGRQPAAAPVRPALGPHPDRRPGHRRVTQDSLRRQVGMVTQDTSLLHRSVRDNILYGRPTPVTPTCCAPPSGPRRTTSSSA
jgi:ATP-binding cassette subfamily B multidrug efflux pump